MEGHVSHILSDRMSSRPMGWSVTGADRMARLRAHYRNRRNMLSLARYQKKDIPKVAGAEYDVLNSNQVLMPEKKGGRLSLPARPVVYGGELIERNFFNTLGGLTISQIRSWLTGTEGISELYADFSDVKKWRERYWATGDAKNYRKLKSWEHEEEYRLVISDMLYQYGESENRALEYDFEVFKGVIFGINTSEYDKKRIVDKVARLKRPDDFAFYQAEYDAEKQKIAIKKKRMWKLK